MNATSRDPRVDDYIAGAPEFAQPIAAHLREMLHEACPGLVEDVKWGLPHFDYHGDMMCVFAAATRHCSFTFVKQAIMVDPRLQANPELPAAKRFMGKLMSIADLPPDAELIAMIREAMALNEQGVKLPTREPREPKEVAIPSELTEALAANPDAKAVFDGRSDSFRKEYAVWIDDAKTDATRQKRIDEALGWIAEGKSRFWKYSK